MANRAGYTVLSTDLALQRHDFDVREGLNERTRELGQMSTGEPMLARTVALFSSVEL